MDTIKKLTLFRNVHNLEMDTIQKWTEFKNRHNVKMDTIKKWTFRNLEINSIQKKAHYRKMDKF